MSRRYTVPYTSTSIHGAMDAQSLSSITQQTYESLMYDALPSISQDGNPSIMPDHTQSTFSADQPTFTDPAVIMSLNEMDDTKLFLSHSPPSMPTSAQSLAPTMLQQQSQATMSLHSAYGTVSDQQLLAGPSSSSSPIGRISNHPSPNGVTTSTNQAAIPTPNIHDTGFLSAATSAAGSSSSPRSHSTTSNPPSANSSAVIPLNNILPTRTGKQVTIGAVVESLFENVINTAVSARDAYHRGENNEIHVQLEEMIESLKLVAGLGFGPKIRTIDLSRAENEVEADGVNATPVPADLSINGVTPPSSASASASAPSFTSARQGMLNSAPVGSAASASGLLGIAPGSSVGASGSRTSLSTANPGNPTRHSHSHSLSSSASNSAHNSMSPPQTMSRPLPLPLSALASAPTSSPSPPLSAGISSTSLGMVGVSGALMTHGASSLSSSITPGSSEPTGLMASPNLDFDISMTSTQLNAASAAAGPSSFVDPARKRNTASAPSEQEEDNFRGGKFMKMSPPASGHLADELHGGSTASAHSTPSPGGTGMTHSYAGTSMTVSSGMPMAGNMNVNMGGSPSMHGPNGTMSMPSSAAIRQISNRTSGVWDGAGVGVSGVASGGNVVIPPPRTGQMERQFSSGLDGMDGTYAQYGDGSTELGHSIARARRTSLSVSTAKPSDLMMDLDGGANVAGGIASPTNPLGEIKRSPPDTASGFGMPPFMGSNMDGNLMGSRHGSPDSVGSRGGADGGDSDASGDEEETTRMGMGLDSRRNSMNVGFNRPSMMAGAGAKRKIGSNNGSGGGGDSACNPAHMLSPQLKAEVDRVFLEYLNRVCSNLEATDSKGEAIHQTLMAKKMARLDESPDFRPFKFRIQAFTNGFVEELTSQGFGEEVVPIKKTKAYLWHHNPYIARFNEDGKKAKSKGNHIWNIEAKKVLPPPPEGSSQPQWIFKKFVRKIAGTPPGMAYIGLKWSWEPKIWDPQLSRSSIEVEFSSPSLPPWLSWNKTVLSGTPGPDTPDCEVVVEAKFMQDGREKKLAIKFPITVAPLSVGDNSFPKSRRPSLTLAGDVNPRRFVSDSVVSQSVGNRTMPHLPPPPATPQETAQVMQVLTNAAQRVAHEAHTQAAIMLPHTGPAQAHQQALLAKQQQVLTATAQAVSNEAQVAFNGRMMGEPTTAAPSVLAAAASAMVQQAARQVQADKTALAVLHHQMSPIPKPPPGPASVSLSDVSIVTQSAVAHAVAITGNQSSEVEVMMTANALIQQRSRAPSLPIVPAGMGEPIRPPLVSNTTAPVAQPNLAMSTMHSGSHPPHFTHTSGSTGSQSGYL